MFRRSTVDGKPPPRVLKEGNLFKQGSIRKSWKERRFVLNDDGILIYTKMGKNKRRTRGVIDLKNSMAMVRGVKYFPHNGWPRDVDENCCLVIQLPKRTFYLYATNRSDMDSWFANFLPFAKVLRDGDPEYFDNDADLP
eukprot:m.128708 g.128708  ORF g.128708 m.128708 type:complete len:139 (-) comp9454_c1_seq1:79-495(-)